MAKETLIEWKNEEEGKIVKVTRDKKKGNRWLEVDLISGAKTALEKLVEDSPMKAAFKWALKYVPKDFHLEDVINTEVSETGLRIEESNGDFYFIEMPQDEAKKFVDVINSSTNLMQGID